MKATFTSALLGLALVCYQPLHAQTTPMAVTSFTLVNADNDQDIRQLTTGDSINTAAISSLNLNIRANTSPATVGSVVFSLTGADTHTQTESLAPYALFSDVGGHYNAWVPTLGKYSLVATPYSDAGGAGTAGTPLSISFKVVKRSLAPTAVASSVALRGLQAYPNPSRDGRYRVVVPAALRGNIRYSLVSVLGAQVGGGTLAADQDGALLLDFSRQLPAEGIYYLRLESNNLTAQLKISR